ncbi:MAG: NAD(P)H-hydrate dehydratase [Planctomycetota bacterium]|jgi:NAD(P)H-hydrate epimerase|nr:NAD(P)H-hydrate dehydratase [Planctomycetota bacterium]
MTPSNIAELPALPVRDPECHKDDNGRVLVIAGSAGMTGAGGMVSLSCLRSGAGVVLWALPRSLNVVGEALNMEVMTLPLPETPSGAPSMDAREILVEAARETDCVVLGPGLPVAGDTGELMRLLIPEIYPPLIVDGGAFSAIGTDMMILRKRQSPTIITPHPGEMGRITGKTIASVQEKRHEFAQKYSKLSGAVVALKGHRTIVTNGQNAYVNESGNPGMATAGSGDVLCGVIAALVGQGMTPFDATRLGVYLHGLAGDLAEAEIGMHGIIASDIINHLPAAFKAYGAMRGDAAP